MVKKVATDFSPFGLLLNGTGVTGNPENRFKYQDKESLALFGLENINDFSARYMDRSIGRFMNIDLESEQRYSLTPYNYLSNNFTNRIDPTGMLDNPIYDTAGNFLGTDDQGLQGKAIVMNKFDFTQSMSHNEALSKSLGTKGLSSEAARTSLVSHYSSLKNRPDYDGFVTISEGIAWAKAHPNAMDNSTTDNTLFLDASKLNFGNLSVSNIPLREERSGNVNLFDYVDLGSGASRATTYALGNTRMQFLNAQTGTVKLFSDGYDWDYHNYNVLNPGQAGRLPNSTRDKLIYLERGRSGLNNSHGFQVFIYGVGKIKTK